MVSTVSNQIETEEEQDLEWRKCRASVHYFFDKYVYIQNRNTGKIIKWQPWDYHLDLLNLLLTERDLILLKARQLGWTWLLTGFGLWKVLFNEAAKGLYMSQKEMDAWGMISKSRFILEHLPPFLRLSSKHEDNRALLDFRAHGSVIEALSSTKDAGRGTDATFVYRDELATHPFGRENFAAIAPAVDAGGQQVDLSTIDKSDETNHFTERVNRALKEATRQDLPSGLNLFRGGESGATLVFGGWKLRPVREEGVSLEDWFAQNVKKKYTPLQVEEQYPETIEQVLRPVQSSPYFDSKSLDAMQDRSIDPLFSGGDIDLHGGLVKIYKMPIPGVRYCIFTDPSEGIEDPFHTVVIDSKTYEGVAEAYGMVPVSLCAQVHHDLVLAYNKAYNSYEANATAGKGFSDQIKLLGTPNQAPRRNPQTDKVVLDKDGNFQYGWWASHSLKEAMLMGLREAINNKNIICHDKVSQVQFRKFYIAEGKIKQMPKGVHDDALIAWTGAYRLTKYVPQGMKLTSWQQ